MSFNHTTLIHWIQKKDGIGLSEAVNRYNQMREEVKNGSDPKEILWEEGLEIIWEERFVEPDKVAELFA